MTFDTLILNGTIVDGTEDLEATGERIFQRMLAVASGERTRSEEVGVGEAEFVPWQTWAQMLLKLSDPGKVPGKDLGRDWISISKEKVFSFYL